MLEWFKIRRNNVPDLPENIPASNQGEFLTQQVGRLIRKFEADRNYSRRVVNLVKVTLILIGGITTILLGLKGYHWFAEREEWLVGGALILSSIGTMLTAWDTFADHTWKWVRYRTTLVNLYNLRDELEFALSGDDHQLRDADAKLLFARLLSILKETNDERMNKRIITLIGGPNGTPPTPSAG